MMLPTSTKHYFLFIFFFLAKTIPKMCLKYVIELRTKLTFSQLYKYFPVLTIKA